MPVTHQQRENRALFNLSRNERMSRGQLHAASVNNAAIEQLVVAGAIAPADEGYAITNEGRELLEWRLIEGVASTITAVQP